MPGLMQLIGLLTARESGPHLEITKYCILVLRTSMEMLTGSKLLKIIFGPQTQ
jgi:hypothetical protein